jgi:aurora kinase, other
MVRTKTSPQFILALKCLYKSEIIESGVEKQIRREIEIQQNLRCDCVDLHRSPDKPRCRHPNILRLYGYFHDSKRIFLMLEFAAKGELYKQLIKKGRFSERRSSRVCILLLLSNSTRS